MNCDKPATPSEVTKELARMHGRLNGLISEAAAMIWADDLLAHRFTSADLKEAGRALPKHIMAQGRYAATGRPTLEDVVELATEARHKRRAQEQQVSDPARLLGHGRSGQREGAERRRAPLAATVVFGMTRLGEISTDAQAAHYYDQMKNLPLDELEIFARQIESKANGKHGRSPFSPLAVFENMKADQ